jgi:ribonuclease D
MKNITLSIEDDILKSGREYARAHNVSFNALVRKLIEQTVKNNSTSWVDDTFEYIDKNIPSSQGISWKREELYRG